MKSISGVIITLLLLSTLFSCQTKDKKEESDDSEEIEVPVYNPGDLQEWNYVEEEAPALPLNQQFANIQDSLNSYRAKAFESEDIKLKYTLEIIEDLEISGVSLNNELKKNLQNSQQKAKKSLYTVETMNNNEVMLKYDENTEQMLFHLRKLTESVKEFDRYKRSVVLYDKILVADRSDFTIRKEYNNYAYQLNALIQSSSENGEELDPKYKQLEKAPIFYGEETL